MPYLTLYKFNLCWFLKSEVNLNSKYVKLYTVYILTITTSLHYQMDMFYTVVCHARAINE